MNRSTNRKTTEEATKEIKTDDEFSQISRELAEKERNLSNWVPKTDLGRLVKAGTVTSMEEIFEKGYKLMEPEIVDTLMKLDEEVLDVSKTTRVTTAGRKFSYRAAVLVGNRNGYIGLGTAKDADRFPAITKAKRNARLNLQRVIMGSGSWEEQPTDDKHSVPMKIVGKSGSVRVLVMPAPKGTGIAVGKNIRKVFELAGVRNVWSKAKGRTSVQLNFVQAAIDALTRPGKMKLSKDLERKFGKN